MRQVLKNLALLLVVGLHSGAIAGPIGFAIEPQFQIAAVGDIVTFDIVYDPGSEGTIGGGLDVIYDPQRLELIDYRYGDLGNPLFQAVPIKYSGRLESLTMADFNGLVSPGVMASVSFRLLAEGAGTIELADTQGRGGPWIGIIDFSYLQPDYRGGIAATQGAEFGLLDIAEGPVEFGQVSIVAPESVQIEILNVGTGPLDIESIYFVQVSTLPVEDFSLASDGCSNQTVVAGGACSFSVTYAPTVLASQRFTRAELRIPSSDPLRPETIVELRAAIASPTIALPIVQFYEARIGEPFQSQTVMLTNTGDWPTTIGSVFTTGNTNPSVFGVTRDECSGQFVDVGASCEIEIDFTPFEEGRFTGSYRVTYANGLFTSSRALDGYTPTGLGFVEYDGPTDFDIVVGSQTVREIAVVNKGSVPLVVEDDAITAEPGFQILSSNCEGASIPPSGACFVTVLVQPVDVGYYSWFELIRTDSLYRSFLTMSLRATAVPPPGAATKGRGN